MWRAVVNTVTNIRLHKMRGICWVIKCKSMFEHNKRSDVQRVCRCCAAHRGDKHSCWHQHASNSSFIVREWRVVYWFIAHQGAVNGLAGSGGGVDRTLQGHVQNCPYRASRSTAGATEGWVVSFTFRPLYPLLPLDRRSGHQNRCGHFGEEINS